MDYTWKARVRWIGKMEATVYVRNNAFSVGQPASFRDKDPLPSAVEMLLGALGADLVNGLGAEAEKLGIVIDAMELALSGRLENVLVTVGVIGEEGEPCFREIKGTLFISTDSDPATVQQAWQTVLRRSPVANTLKQAATLEIELRHA